MIIGASAACFFALGSIVNNFLSVKDMFVVCAALIFVVWLIILLFLKEERVTGNRKEIASNINTKESLKILLSDKLFVRLNLAGFINNFIMTDLFYILPQYLEKITGMSGMWKIFIPAVVIAIICMRKVIVFVERGYSLKVIKISFVVTAF